MRIQKNGKLYVWAEDRSCLAFFRRKITAIFLASVPFLETKSARSVISRKAPQMQFMRKNVEKHAKDC